MTQEDVKEVFQVLTLEGTRVCVGGFINLQCLLRLIVKQDVAPPSLVLADVIKMKLHGWKHLLHLLREVRKILKSIKNAESTV